MCCFVLICRDFTKCQTHSKLLQYLVTFSSMLQKCYPQLHLCLRLKILSSSDRHPISLNFFDNMNCFMEIDLDHSQLAQGYQLFGKICLYHKADKYIMHNCSVGDKYHYCQQSQNFLWSIFRVGGNVTSYCECCIAAVMYSSVESQLPKCVLEYCLTLLKPNKPTCVRRGGKINPNPFTHSNPPTLIEPKPI